MPENLADSLVVIDFETTGLSPDNGDRAIEIGAVRISQGKVVDEFQALMNPGRRISDFIENYTGITNVMLRTAKPCKMVMNDFVDYLANDNLVAHNASFDKRFLDAELAKISREYSGDFACSLLLSRRLNQLAPSHKLGDLIQYKNIPSEGGYHRALYDTQMTTKLWLTMIDDIKTRTQLENIPFSLVQKLSKQPKNSVQRFLNDYRIKAGQI